MRVLLTGGAGFIGAHLARSFIDRGDSVVILDDFNDYYDPALKRARLAALVGTSAPVVTADIRNGRDLVDVVRVAHPDAVVHLAAWAGVRPSRNHAELFAEANVQGTVNVFEACRRTDVRRVVFASSSSVYGRTVTIPTTEAEALEGPTSGYGVSKRAGELYARLYHQLDGMHIACLRFFTVYGPWGRPDMAPWKFTERIVQGRPITLHVRARDGREVQRDFTEVSDIVQGTLSAVDRDEPFLVVNLGAADPVPLRRFVAAIERAVGRSAIVAEQTLPEEESVQTGADLTAAATRLGFRPRVRLEEGIKRFVDWYQSEYQAHFPAGIVPSRYWQ